ncbi:hypothetical protein [Chamaesiphon sp. OTE_8_metabat_110]|uniref:hypothetical protein n=1 Tax=Chamaesiphon sp. OTE_8_metabat_110 TaxID=2964696 RepID=UPI00286C8338|nr:hypothetical protein [Chamaesiphon sp. OTE_8_metabat_110]
MAKNSFDPVGTLSIGNVVTTATILYRSNFKRYLQVSLRATAWLVALGVAALVFGVIGALLFGITKSWLVFIPVGLGGIGVTLYLIAKYSTDRAVICRLAYQQLIDAPETVADATRQLTPRTWAFLRLSLLLGLYMFLITFGAYIAFALTLFIIAGIFGVLSQGNLGTFAYIIIVVLGIGLGVLAIALVLRFYAYWFVSELPLALESTSTSSLASFGLRRSRQLSSTAVRQIILIITVAFLITIPLSMISSIPSFIGQAMTLSTTQSVIATGGFLVFISFILNIAIELFVMPFWQIIKAIVYFDLRNRREGGDLIV